ncbi:acetyl-CoA carboxylase biotin carboxyl carrier protein subunit [Bordetella petrii]|uniref:acetyl-CoA carboxylase biotin carboxyl carrier protein subunit n=1 Tax=Bordetella petrii TaxID=94624 RepID=UPI002E768E8B|nr:acetyl-CoA carboxylase biotin carboxyl carrier protein subunit [Bordetella petrii]
MSKLEAPVTGRIVAVLVKAGDRVAAGDTVAMIESMKMEIPVEAERDGRVVRVLAAEGDEVDEGQALLDQE